MIIAGIGEILWDIYSDERHIGGAIANCIHHVKQLGHDGLLFSRIGNDRAGGELKNAFSAKGHDTEWIQVDPVHKTGWVRVALDEHNEPSFTCNEVAAYDYLEWDDQWPEVLSSLDAVIFGTFAQRTGQSAEVTRRFLREAGGALKVFDINIRSWNDITRLNIQTCLPVADIVKLNEDEYTKLREIFPLLSDNPADGMRELVDLGRLKLACLTAGKWGCILSDSEKTIYLPGEKTHVIDATGAGDAFISALTIKFLEGDSLAQVGRFANRTAAIVVLSKGAAPHYLIESIERPRDEVSEFNVREGWEKWLV